MKPLLDRLEDKPKASAFNLPVGKECYSSYYINGPASTPMLSTFSSLVVWSVLELTLFGFSFYHVSLSIWTADC